MKPKDLDRLKKNGVGGFTTAEEQQVLIGLAHEYLVLWAENQRLREALEKIANMKPMGYPTTQASMQIIAQEALKEQR